MILDDDVLKQALVLYNEETMNQIPDIIGIHNYSYRFEIIIIAEVIFYEK